MGNGIEYYLSFSWLSSIIFNDDSSSRLLSYMIIWSPRPLQLLNLDGDGSQSHSNLNWFQFFPPQLFKGRYCNFPQEYWENTTWEQGKLFGGYLSRYEMWCWWFRREGFLLVRSLITGMANNFLPLSTLNIFFASLLSEKRRSALIPSNLD